MFIREELIFPSGGESNYRIPSVVVTNSGTVLAFCNDRRNTVRDHATDTVLVCARKEKGKAWGKPTTLLERSGVCYLIGSAVYDRETDTAFCFVKVKFARDEFGNFSQEDRARQEMEDARRAEEMGIALGNFLLESHDDGKSWTMNQVAEEPFVFTNVDGLTVSAGVQTHGAAHGIQLRYGAYRGRLLCPSRIFAGHYTNWIDIRKYVYNNAVYSDDHGKTWRVSAPVQIGTGEGTLIEQGTGEILYNSRAYFADGKRYLAKSRDGGASYEDLGTDAFLLEEKRIGCNASFLRVPREELGEKASLLPDGVKAVTIFVNPRADSRRNMTACISFDDGVTWREAKQFYEGACAYSSLDFSPADKHFYLIYEKGVEKPYTLGISAVEFDLEWLLDLDE